MRVRIMQTTAKPISVVLAKPLQQQVADAVRDQAVPISRLLRLMWALEAETTPVNENLRAQLRRRIGAPLAG